MENEKQNQFRFQTVSAVVVVVIVVFEQFECRSEKVTTPQNCAQTHTANDKRTRKWNEMKTTKYIKKICLLTKYQNLQQIMSIDSSVAFCI